MRVIGAGILDPAELLDRNVAMGAPRSTGLHCSDIYKSLMKEIAPKRFDKRDENGDPLPMDMVRVETGSAFETILEQGLAARHPGLSRPGEVVWDGIACSPDGLLFDDDGWMLLEYKATWMSIGQGIDDKRFWHWWVQVRAYLYALNAALGLEVTRVRLIPLFVRGHYKYEPTLVPGFADPLPEGPLMPYFDREFSPADQLETWSMLVKHAYSKGMLSR